MGLILDLLFPKKCVSCKSLGDYFCQSCVRHIKQGNLLCPECKKDAVGGETHPVCRKRYGMDGLWSLGLYSGSLKLCVQKLKYKFIQELALNLTDITLEYWVKYQPFLLDKIKAGRGIGWAVVPVPLFWFRENYRGFNQSSLIGKNFAQKLGLDYFECLKRTRYTKSQTRLKSKDRYQNIKNAFEIIHDFPLNAFPYTLLIDDVWTTGSTMRECAYILKKNGAKQVWGITVAR